MKVWLLLQFVFMMMNFSQGHEMSLSVQASIFSCCLSSQFVERQHHVTFEITCKCDLYTEKTQKTFKALI